MKWPLPVMLHGLLISSDKLPEASSMDEQAQVWSCFPVFRAEPRTGAVGQATVDSGCPSWQSGLELELSELESCNGLGLDPS